ncbi:MAG: hypothetical protein NWF13_03640 [Candidatus Bathyarchaeota archaeon]|nr:hypothetical protein [Candidatus Bathyarchaeota archaeon]
MPCKIRLNGLRTSLGSVGPIRQPSEYHDETGRHRYRRFMDHGLVDCFEPCRW